jgi:hypothetical protein
MTHATLLWSIWQDLARSLRLGLLSARIPPLRRVDHRHGHQCRRTHVTQSVLALERPFDWKAMESFAEYGAWHPDRVTRSLTGLVETLLAGSGTATMSRLSMTPRSIAAASRLGHLHLPRYTARCPNRATTVRAHNWVVLGALLTSRRSRPGSCLSPANFTSANRSCPSGLGSPAAANRSAPSASWPWTCSGNRPG